MIYTSYFGKLKTIPKDMVPISICGKAPDWYTGLQYKKVAPKLKFFLQWKQNHDNAFYVEHYQEEVLDTLDADKVVEEILRLSEGKDAVLICYEKPDEFCHRHLLAEWLILHGYDCKELEL